MGLRRFLSFIGRVTERRTKVNKSDAKKQQEARRGIPLTRIKTEEEATEYERTKSANWAITEAPKNKALNGRDGYVTVSDLYGKAVKVKVKDINVDVDKVDVDKEKYNLKGNLRITGRVPLER